MTDLQNRIKNLPPEQRALLEKKLREKALLKAKENRIPIREDLSTLPMSPEQERLWFLNQLNPTSSFYNMPAAIRITGPINLDALEDSLKVIINQHKIFSVIFINEKDGPVQKIIDSDFCLEQVDISNQSYDLNELLDFEANKSFDLTHGPLFRIKIYKINTNENVLLFTFHHIIADGWSIGILISELAKIYEAKSQSELYELEELPIQYFDYAEWRKKYLSESFVNKEIKYWQDKLSGMPQYLELVHDKIRPVNQTFNGDRVNISIPYDQHRKLVNIGSKITATPFMIYLTILEALLYRFSNQDDFGIGTVSTGRDAPELKSLIGFFVNTIVLRAELNEEISFEELLEEVRKQTIESFDHQILPFDKIVDNVVKEKNITHSPLFQVMYDYQEAPLKNLKLSNISLELVDQEISSAKFDLVFIIEDLTDNLKISLEYNTDIFNKSTIDSLINTIPNLIRGIVENPKQKISILPLMLESEKHQIIAEQNKTKTDYQLDYCIQELFKQQVDKTPDATALSFGEDKLTYSELDKFSNDVASYLIEKKVEPQDKIALFMERSFDLIVSTLAILKVGAVYAPLDTAYPLDRIKFMLKDLDTKLIITQKNLLPITKKIGIPAFTLDQVNDKISHNKGAEIQYVANSSSIAYIMYTSGSTGKPKGVLIPHKAVNRLVRNTNYIDITEKDKIAQIANVSFDAATFEIWGSLLNGAELVILEKDLVLSPENFANYLERFNISIMFITTALFNQMVNEYPSAFESINILMFGGEKADKVAVKKSLDNGPPKKLINVYGPTENTTFSTWYHVKKYNEKSITIPIGKAISNTSLFILDNNLAPLPLGFPGELYLGGDGLAEGYYKREELTESIFVKNPFHNKEKLYKTGDLVRSTKEGNLEFIRRIDDQIKLRGFRIELGEIETFLKNIQSIKDAIVTVEGNTSLDKKLIAYIVHSTDKTFDMNEVQSLLTKEFPDYMIPKRINLLDSIPLTPNGKVDKKKIAEFNLEQKEDKLFIEPRNKFEDYLAELWREILNIDKVSIYDSFFDLGGNSLQAAVFINRLQKYLDVEIQVQSIFLAPTIADFSHYAGEYYSEIISKLFGTVHKDFKTNLKSEEISILDEAKIKKFNNIVTPLKQTFNVRASKNPSAIFILSPPRSGSTLLRVMLEGHEKLFAPPELDLLSYNTLGERKAQLSGEYNLWLEATIRSIMELKHCTAGDAEKIMTDFEDENISVKDFYSKLQSWAGERILVDKTPTYALDIKILDRAEQYFENALYIHLARHPYASIYSFIEAKLDQNFFRYKHPFSRLELAELIWMTCHKNTLEFLKNIPSERQLRINFEDLVTNSEQEMKIMSKFLGIEFDEKLIQPYRGKRMTDPVKENSQMVGDFKFYLRNKIDSNVTQRWKNYHHTDFLSDQALYLAKELGYEVKTKTELNPHEKPKYSQLEKVARTDKLPLSYAQQRLWFLEQLETGKPTYNIPSLVELHGKLNIKKLERSINNIIERQESLRTYFREEGGKAEQLILTEFKIPLKIISLIEYDEEKKRSESEKIIVRESRELFDLSEPPLFRLILLIIGHERHELLLTMHHIISDGWSMEVFVKELSMFYSMEEEGIKKYNKNLEFQYADYAVWQRQWLAGDVYIRQAEYWKDKLKDAPPLLELPTDFNRLPEQRQKGKRIKFQIESKLIENSLNICNRENITPFVLFFTAFNLLLHKYSQSNDILVGIPVAGRTRSEIEPIIGLFVNTLVMRNDFSQDYTLRQMLHNVNHVFIEALNNQEIPFEKLLDELKIERSLSHPPLFQVMFVFNNSPVSNIELHELKIQPQPLDLGTSKFDLNLVLTKRNKILTGVFEYDTDLFAKQTIETMISHFENIVNNLVNNSSKQISEITLSKESERIQLLQDFAGNYIPNSNRELLHLIFEDNLYNHSDKLAVIINDKSICFNELNTKANKLANYLLKKDCKKESIIAICLERSIESIISIFAIWKAGATYLPLDPSYPNDRIDLMLQNSGSKILITDSSISKSISSNNTEVVILSEEWQKVNIEDDKNLELQLDPQNLAYMIYTSGSTGIPKGVTIQHNSAINLAKELNQRIYSDYKNEKLRISLNAPLPFDASMQEIVMLIYGHCLVIIPEEIRLDGNAFIDYMKKYKIDLLDCVPTQLKVLIEQGLISNEDYNPKIVLVGGEPIDSATWDKIKTARHIKFFNMYGPTESTVDSTFCEINKYSIKPIIGKPINNSLHYILDENMNPSPKGIPGELHIGGECLARGYWERPDLTAEKFIPNPYSENPGERIYKTADLSRFMHDGNIEYLRRVDDQVKLRGFRIELGEIESVLNKHDSIKSSVALIKENEKGNKNLIAYYIKAKEVEIRVPDLKEFISRMLPSYMVPSFYVELKTFPLLPNKKVNRKLFPDPIFTREAVESEYTAPSTEIERILVDIWRELLQVENLGIDDNFFELGGDSILGLQLISKSNEAGIRISPKNIFQSPTIRELSSLAGKVKPITAEQGQLVGNVDLNPIQHWFFSQNFTTSAHWNQSILLEINEKFDTEILKKAFAKLLEHHDALRMRFLFENNKWTQFYDNLTADLHFSVVDLTMYDDKNIHEIVDNESEIIQSSLNLTDGPVVKFAYLRCCEDHPDYLLLVAHHLVVDSVSWRVITDDLQKVYSQVKIGVQPELPRKTSSFGYWSKLLTEYADSKAILNQIEFWKNQSDLQKSINVSTSQNSLNTEGVSDSVSFLIDKDLTKRLEKELPKIFNTDVKDVLLTTFVRAYSKWKGSRKICITLEGHGREDIFEDIDLSRTVGWFTSIYPVVLDLEDSIQPVDALKIIKEQLRKIPQNGIGYGILKHISKNINCSDLPHLSEISFNYLGQYNIDSGEKSLFNIQELYKGSERANENSRPFQIDIVSSILNGQLHINMVYGTKIFNSNEMKNLSDLYVNEIQTLISETLSISGGYTPSDFNDVDLDDQDLNSILTELNE